MSGRAPVGALAALLLAAPLLAPAPASAQGTDGERPVEEKLERVRERLGSGDAERIGEAATAARRAGVPAGPVVDKALEGLAKGVPPARLVPAVEAYVDRLVRAAGVLGEDGAHPPAEIVAAADALGRGVPARELRAVGRAAGTEERAIALVVLGDLVEMGVPAGRAEGAVREALAAGRGGEALLQLPGLVRRRVRAGTPPARAAEQAGAALRRGSPAGPPVPPGAGPPDGQGPPDGGPPDGQGPPQGAGPPGGPSLSRGASLPAGASLALEAPLSDRASFPDRASLPVGGS